MTTGKPTKVGNTTVLLKEVANGCNVLHWFERMDMSLGKMDLFVRDIFLFTQYTLRKPMHKL